MTGCSTNIAMTIDYHFNVYNFHNALKTHF